MQAYTNAKRKFEDSDVWKFQFVAGAYRTATCQLFSLSTFRKLIREPAPRESLPRHGMLCIA